MQRMRALRAAVTATTYLPLDTAVQVEVESVSGDMDMHFLNADLTNAYRNLTNVVLALVPAAAANTPALLLGAHFDSTLDTPGALQSGVGQTPPPSSRTCSLGPASSPGGECAAYYCVHSMRNCEHKGPSSHCSFGHQALLC